MSITAECNACGRKYQAPASLAGKRVRCKQCGNIFQLPEADSGTPGPDLDALAALEKSYHSMDATATGADAPAENDESDSEGSPGELRSARLNVRFNFPFARELDQWLPLVLFIIGAFWLGRTGYLLQLEDIGTPSIPWIAGARVGLAALAYIAIIAPITLAMIRSAGRRLGYRMPSGDRFRAFAAFLPAYALTYSMAVNGQGQVTVIILAAIVGFLLGLAATWFLFRLQVMEIAPTAGYVGAGYLIGIVVTVGIFFGLNLLTMNILLSVKKPYLVKASPFGPGTAWFTEEQLREPAPPKVTIPPPTSVASNPDNPGQDVATGGGFIKSAKLASISTQIDSVLFPLVESRSLATVRMSGNGATIESWDTDTWKSNGAQPVSNGQARLVLSPDGQRLALISTFPSLSAQVLNFVDKTTSLLAFEDRPGVSTNPELIGFISPVLLLSRWQRPGGYAFELIEVTTRRQVYRMETPGYEPNGTCLIINQNGTLAALATKDREAGTNQVKPYVILYDLTKGAELGRTEIKQLGAQWPVSPTGMAFSFDSKKLAILFEQGGNGLIKQYMVDPTNSAKEKVLATLGEDIFYPAGPLPGRDVRLFSGNAMTYLPNGDFWLLYGQGIFASRNGQFIADLGAGMVERSIVKRPDGLIIVTPGNPRQISVLQLDTTKFP